MSKFYIIGEPDTDSGFVHMDDEGIPSVFATEAEAIETAKEYAPCIVVKPVAEVAQTQRIKVTKIK